MAAPSADRPLTTTERALLDALLAHDFTGADLLRAQLDEATATPGCTCGCGTIDLHVPATAPSAGVAGPAPVEGTVTGPDGRPTGGVLLFVEDGRLARLDVTSYGDPLPVPDPARVTWGPTAWAREDTVRRPARYRR
ncbi:hypothetical protein [Modestobacter sp. SSW1-42]|uniref:hypothetical protein n=1 Tax=Modestobacter sp. SSW1-42 TaxID=596372 RepID=UPI00398596AA